MINTTRIFGLSGSGMDIDQMVKDLMKVQRIRQDRIKQNKTIADWQREGYREMNNLLRSLRDSTFTMKLQGAFLANKATSSNEDIIKVSAGATAVAGNNSVLVTQLAGNARLNSGEPIIFDGTKATLKDQLGLDTSSGSLVQFRVNGSEMITVDLAADTMKSLISKINNARMAGGASAAISAFFDQAVRHVFISSTTTGSSARIEFSDMDDPAGLFAALKLDVANPVYGVNARFKLNGVSLEQQSNQFTIAGMNFTLSGVQQETDPPVSINITKDTEAVFKTIKSFVELYNTTIEKLNQKLGEEKHRDYLPLTDEQREKLTEDQQKRWEEKARSGLLRNDTLLSGVVSKLRLSITSTVDGLDASLNTLAAIGIRTGGYYERGKLYIDEQKLREAISSNLEAVMDLFAKSSEVAGEKGLAVRLYDDLTGGIKQLINRAGSQNSFSLLDNSVMGKRISEYDKQIAAWDTRLQKFEEKYYRQFAAMEKALSRMNQQSFWLYQQFNSSR